MDLRRYEEKRLIEKREFTLKQIGSPLTRAMKDLKTARAVLDIDPEWAYTIAYQAMLRAARSLIFSLGYRPKGTEQHRITIEIVSEILGKKFEDLIEMFDTMRRKRHDFIYQSKSIMSDIEIINSLKLAEEFITKIISLVEKNNPQLKFEF